MATNFMSPILAVLPALSVSTVLKIQIPTFETSIVVDGTNPFGIAFVDVNVPESSGGLGLLAFGLIGAGTAIQTKRKQPSSKNVQL